MSDNPISYLADRIQRASPRERDDLILKLLDDFCEEYARQSPGCDGNEVVANMNRFIALLTTEAQAQAYNKLLSGPSMGSA